MMVRTELKRMPETLEGTYDRILQGIPNLHKTFVQSAMNWLAFSMRPLTVSELAEATVIDPKSERFDPDECRFVDEQLILSLCGTLVSTSSKECDAKNKDWLNEKYEMQYGWAYNPHIEKSIQVVTLSHFSVKEYIISETLKDSSLSAFYISDRLAHRFLTECCFRYLLDLNLHEMSTKYNEHYASFPLYQYSARFWLDHWRESGMKVEDTKNDLLYALFDTSDLTGYTNWLNCYNPDDYAFGADQNMRSYQHRVQFSAHAFPEPIYFAAMIGDLALVQSLVEQGNDIVAPEGHFGSALGASAFHGHVDLVKYFLDNGADPNLRVRVFGSVLQIAAAGGCVEVVRLLLDAGADINMEGGTYNTALVAAASQEHHDVVSLLIKRGADIHAGSRTHGSSLYQAAAAGDTKTVVTLLGAGADVNDATGMDGTPLHGAVHSGKISLVRLLIGRGADVNKGTVRGDGYPIVAAAEEGYAQIVRILLNAGADPNPVDGIDGTTSLEAAIESRDMPTFRAVLDGGGSPNTIFRSYVNGFQSALWTGEVAMARILLERHAAFEDKAFVESVKRYEQDPYFFHTLLERGANVDAHLGENGSALHHAITDGGEKATRLLLEKTPYIEAVSELGTPLCLAAFKGMTSVAKELVRRGADVRRGVKWITPLYHACHTGDRDLVALLLKAGADVNFGGGAAISAALWKENEDLVRFLVEEHGADLNLVTKTGWYHTPIQHAVLDGNMPMIKHLLSLGADINGPAGRDGSVLHYAFGSKKCSRELIEFLLENGAKVDESVQGESLLCKIIYTDMKDFIPRLIELGADVKQTRNGLTALGKSFMDGNQSTVDLLLAHGASFTDSGDSLLIEAVESKSIDEIRMLLDHGIYPNTKDHYKTALSVSELQKIVDSLATTLSEIRGRRVRYPFRLSGMRIRLNLLSKSLSLNSVTDAYSGSCTSRGQRHHRPFAGVRRRFERQYRHPPRCSGNCMRCNTQ
jgi:ankyrin repeat protein